MTTQECSVEGCDRSSTRRGLCNRHYLADRKAGRLPPRPGDLSDPTNIIDGERWLPVPDHSDYEVSDFGRVASLKWRSRHLLRTSRTSGYPTVNLRRDGATYYSSVHVLVMLAFVGSCPEGLEVRHLDGDPDNRALVNLRYGTHTENMQDVLRHGTHPMASKVVCKKGHPFDEANTYLAPDGRRICRRCRHDRQVQARATHYEAGDAVLSPDASRVIP